MKFRLLRPLLRVWRSKAYRPGTLGRSLSIGMVVGFSPTVGAQAVICLIFGLIWNRLSEIKLNLPAMLVGSIVVNPLTMGPTYYLYYKIGCLFRVCEPIATDHFASLGAITDLGQAIVIPVVIGSLPFMLAGAPLGYWLGHRAEVFLHNRRKKKLARNKIGFAAVSSK